ncbi:MAG: hypothetical protein V1874_13040 [Spirochaetota bacterium]
MKIKIKVLFSLFFFILVFTFGCWSSKETKEDPIAVINVDINELNGFSNQFTMISAQPAAKPEGNGASSTTYSFTLTSAAGTSGSYIASSNSELASAGDKSLTAKNSIYGAGQIACDNKMRQIENELLASQKTQLTKSTRSGINLSAPATPIVGIPWENVKVYNGTSMVLIDTHCRYITTYAYIFIDDDDWPAFTSGGTYGTAFDTTYEKNHTKFGTENDTDGNGKVIIVFSGKLTGGLLGYFYSGDKYAYNASTNPDSNEGDIFYITTDGYTSSTINGTLAHEFQHMIYFDQHVNRGVTSTYTWLNEALSQAAEYYNTYTDNHLGHIQNFLANGWEGLSLTHWASLGNYGYGAIFIRYLIDQYGDTAIYNMCSTSNVGIHAVEAATGQDFNTIFNNFAQALVLSDVASNTNTLYQFKNPPLDLEDVQPTPLNGRRGLTTSYLLVPGNSANWWLYPYEIWFVNWTGTFKSMTITGNNIACNPIGYN